MINTLLHFILDVLKEERGGLSGHILFQRVDRTEPLGVHDDRR